jgi:hypothetical protein
MISTTYIARFYEHIKREVEVLSGLYASGPSPGAQNLHIKNITDVTATVGARETKCDKMSFG